MILDAVVLAGGRSSRLDGSPKSRLVFEGATLLERTVDAASAARRVVVVGDDRVVGTLHAREVPEFGGPAAGIAAGLDALLAANPVAPDRILVIACDMPGVTEVVPALLAEFDPAIDGTIAIDADGRAQFLAGVYSARALGEAVARNRDGLANLSVRALLAGLRLHETTSAGTSTTDIDTWADAARFGISPSGTFPIDIPNRGDSMSDANSSQSDSSDTEALLAEWSRELAGALGLGDLDADIDGVLGLAGVAARAVVRPAAPLTTFLVGYAAGIAAAGGAAPASAVEHAASIARSLAATRPPRDPA